MLRLRECLLSRVLSSPWPISPSLHRLLSAAGAPIFPSLHRLLSVTGAPISPAAPVGFAVEDYLVATCGLSRPQAIKASSKLSHLSSASKPDAVLAFLSGLGLSKTDVAALVAKDPQFLCAGVERTLSPIVVELTGLGLSRPEIARLIPLSPRNFRCRSIGSKLQFYVSLFGSFEDLLRALKSSSGLILNCSLEKTVRPAVALLQECGLSACDIAKLYARRPMLPGTSLERVRAMIACVEGLGVRCCSGMFREALECISTNFSKERIAAQVEYLKKTFRWSDAEVRIAVSATPFLLRKSKEMLQHRSKFLLSEVGLEPVYIARRPSMLGLSLEGRLRPRYCVVKFLEKNELVKLRWSYNTIVLANDKVFVEKFIHPHKEAAPRLAEDYAAACRGELPARFIFT